MKTEKNPTMYFLNFGSQIRIPDANCIAPKIFQTVGEMLSANEQGGSKNNKNLSAPIIKKRRLQMPMMIFFKFIVFNLEVSYVVRGASYEERGETPVSYTHLTLPTICSV